MADDAKQLLSLIGTAAESGERFYNDVRVAVEFALTLVVKYKLKIHPSLT